MVIGSSVQVVLQPLWTLVIDVSQAPRAGPILKPPPRSTSERIQSHKSEKRPPPLQSVWPLMSTLRLRNAAEPRCIIDPNPINVNEGSGLMERGGRLWENPEPRNRPREEREGRNGLTGRCHDDMEAV